MFKNNLNKILFVLVLSLTVFASNALAGQPVTEETPGTIKVIGSAVVTATPDIAYITLGVETKDTSAATASEQNATSMANVIASLKQFGLKDSEMTTSSYNIYSYQEIDRVGDPHSYVTVYSVRNQLNIKTDRLGDVGKIIDLAIKAGANQVQGIKFDLEDKSELQMQALKNATKQASSKAAAIAEAGNVDIKGIVNITEEYDTYIPYQEVAMFRSAGGAMADTQINPSDVEVTARISAEYWF